MLGLIRPNQDAGLTLYLVLELYRLTRCRISLCRLRDILAPCANVMAIREKPDKDAQVEAGLLLLNPKTPAFAPHARALGLPSLAA